MRMWSEGLGKMELVIDFCQYGVVQEDHDTVIKGITNEPVEWEFTARFNGDDIPGLLNMLFKRETLTFVLKNVKVLFRFVFEKLFMRRKYREVLTK